MLTEEYKNNQRLCFMCEDVIITNEVHVVNIRYDTIRDAILTCARKPT